MTTLYASGLEKSYKSRKVVSSLSLEVSNGEVVGLLGPNGAGKTTAFYMIVGLVPCDAGPILLGDTDITAPAHAPRRANGPRLSAAGSFGLPQAVGGGQRARHPGDCGATSTARRASSGSRNCSRSCASATCAAASGSRLSGGERRRVEIARALAAEPHFMLLDEPFAGVDPLSVLDIQRIIRELTSRGIGVLITDHNVRETLGVAAGRTSSTRGR